MTVIITGANRGLGYETALALAADAERTIVLAGRDMPRLTQAAQDIQSRTSHPQLVPIAVDLADLASVRAFAAELRTRALPALTAIVCNAAVSFPTVQERSADGYELTFAVNHLGHFLLVHLLLEHLQPPARILFVSSDRHDPEQISGRMQPAPYRKAEWLAYPERNPNLPADDAAAGSQAYSTSKLCNVLCMLEFSRRLAAVGANDITVNAFNPGLIAGTGLGRNQKGLMRLAWFYILPLLRPLMGTVARTAPQSGADLAYLTTAPELADVTATYFDGRHAKAPSADALNPDNASDLWRTSVALAHLQPQETMLSIAD